MADGNRVFTGHVEPASTAFLRPLSALTILVIDWPLFGGTAVTLGLGMVFELFFGAILAASVVAILQTRAGDPRWYWKSLLAAGVVGIPTPVAGTSYAVAVLSLAGVKGALDLLRGEKPAQPQPPPGAAR